LTRRPHSATFFGVIRRSPCEVYIKYLLLHPDGYGDVDIIDLLRLKQLDFLGVGYLQRLRRGLKPPKTFRPFDRFHKVSSRYLQENQVYYLFHPDAAMERALALLEDPQMKELIESMLITEDPEPLIVYRVQSAGRKCTERAVERYRFNFFNPTLVDGTELRALLRYRVDFMDPNGDMYDEQMRQALQKSTHRDSRRIVAAQPTKSLGSLLNQMRMGFLPSQLQLQKLMEAARAAALAQIDAAALAGGGTSAQEARDFATTAKLISEMLQDVGGTDAELTRDLQKLALQTESAPVPSVFELTGGDHTVDLLPAPAQEVESDA
jgi:hypothetical protein